MSFLSLELYLHPAECLLSKKKRPVLTQYSEQDDDDVVSSCLQFPSENDLKPSDLFRKGQIASWFSADEIVNESKA